MPALILDKKEKVLSRFLSNNGSVQDPCAVESDRALINPWTAEEREIFLDKYATFGKDFRKISSFLDHKTTADCVEFYYKNHKSDIFKKTKQQELKKQEKSAPTTRYLMTSGKKWSKEMNAVSLDMLGAASAIVAHDYEDMKSAKIFSSSCSDRKLRGDDVIREISSSYDIEDERETEAADVLAGICGSLSSEAMSSCITSSADPGEGTQDCKSSKPGSEPSGSRCPRTAEVMQNVDDDTCSDESCGYMDPVDWTDEEKSSFVRAFTSYGKDFVMISRYVRTKSRDQCKVFFSKARKCLGLEMPYPGPGNGEIPATDDPDGGRSDTEDTCVVENDLASCGDKSSDRTDESVTIPTSNIGHNHDDNNPMNLHDSVDLSDECIAVRVIENDLTGRSQNSLPPDCQAEDMPDVLPDDGSALNEDLENTVRLQYHENGDASVASNCGEEPISGKTGTPLSDEQYKAVAEIAGEKPEPNPKSGGQETCSMGQGSLNFSMQVETSVFAGHLQPATSPYVSRAEIGVQPLQVYLKKCRRSSVHSVGELPLLSKTHESEKPSKNGDVKLFGQILSKSSTTDKPASDIQGSSSSSSCCEGRSFHHGSSCSSLDVLSVSNETDKCGHSNGSLGPESFPVTSFGLWDANRMQSGNSSLPDSALSRAKFPAGDVRAEGSCNGLTDPVAALKLHYGVNLGGVRDYESWRGQNGDVGR